MTYTDVSEVMQRAYNLHRRADAEVLATRLAADLGLVDETVLALAAEPTFGPEAVSRVVAALTIDDCMELAWSHGWTDDNLGEVKLSQVEKAVRGAIIRRLEGPVEELASDWRRRRLA